MKKYIIKKELINDYVKREVKKKMKTIIMGFSVSFILIFIFSYSYNAHKILTPFLLMFFLLLLGIIYESTSSQIKNLISLTAIIISEDSKSKILNTEDLNLMNKIGVSRNEYRYGVQINQSIKFSEIQNTYLSENEIIIQSIHYDFFTSNGKICIPKEFENYDLIKSEIKKDSEKYKLFKSEAI